ncbi:MAG: MarR family EPS-associated transcriptional regulator [Candidatus Macondimonas sp.]
MSPEEVRYRLLQRLARDPAVSQRELAVELGVSVGKINYCLQALIEKGHVKFDNFRRNPDKRHYAYLLTPTGIEAKAWATVQFLRRKRAEYETIRAEIEALQAELAQQASSPVLDENPGANPTESTTGRGP